MTQGTKPAPVLQFHRAAAQTLATDALERNGFAADIFHNPHEGARPWTFIVTRDGSPEVLYWGRETTLELARRAADGLLDGLTVVAAAG